jgi:hypothetical protein
MNAQQLRTWKNTGGQKAVTADEIAQMTQGGHQYANKQQQDAQQVQQDIGQPQGNASQGQEQPETAGEAQNSPAEASEPQEDTSTPPEEQNVPDEPLFPNTSTLQGEDGLNQLMKTYEQWQSQGSTHFDTVFPQFWNSVSMLQESGNPEAQKFHARIMNDGAGQPGAVSMTADTGNSLVLQYLETAPQHRASGKNKKRERGLGVRMVAQAIQDSIDKGYGGKVELTSLSMQATQKFYQSLGFERVSGLHYEISPEKAQALVEKVKGAYGANAQPAQMPKKGKKNLAVAAKALPTEPLGQDQDDDEDYPDLRYENQPEDLEAWKRQLEDLEDKLDGLIAGDVKGYVGSRLKKLNINGMPKLPEEGVMDNGRPEPDRGTGKGY